MSKKRLAVSPERRRSESKRAERLWGPYNRRNELLATLGFASYGEYLRSELWSGIRLRVLKRDRWTCFDCGECGSQVHHERYDMETMVGRSLRRLHTVCARCHKRLELQGDRKRPAKAVAKRTRGIRNRRHRERKRATRNMTAVLPPLTGTDAELRAAGEVVRLALAAGVL